MQHIPNYFKEKPLKKQANAPPPQANKINKVGKKKATAIEDKVANDGPHNKADTFAQSKATVVHDKIANNGPQATKITRKMCKYIAFAICILTLNSGKFYLDE